jgi:predicted metal-dependent phosphoesterase TrpH
MMKITSNITLSRCCDLHTHSTYSDGSCTPTEIIEQAKALSLSAVALTDHNTIGGAREFAQAASEYGVEAVVGVEMSVGYGEKEIHMVGLFVSEEKYGQINEYLENIQLKKDIASYELYKALKAAGYDINYERIVSAGKMGSVNRVHFANELIRCGYISTIAEGFEGVLSEKHGFYKPAPRPDAFDVIEFFCGLGITPILAHPFLNLTYDELRTFLPKAKAHGLAAIETNYSTFTAEQTATAHALAEEFGLLKSGGSDFHGANKPNIALGIGLGDLRVPVEYYTTLAASNLQ